MTKRRNVTIEQFGIAFNDAADTQVICVCGDLRGGDVYMLRTKQVQIEIRVTPTGRLRLGAVQKAGRITARGVR